MSTDKLETGGPAYPIPCDDDRDCFSRANSGYGGMTTRTYAAIKLCVPQSEHEFINDMIRESQRFELAKAAMQGLVSRPGAAAHFASHGTTVESVMANAANKIADAPSPEKKENPHD